MGLNNFLNKTKLPFLVSFEVMLLIRTIGIYSLIPSKFDSLVFSLLSLWGLIYILNQLYTSIKNKKFDQFNPFLLIFLAMILLSTLVHYQVYLVANMKLIFWQAIYLLVIYQIGKEYDRKTLRLLERILLVFWAVLVVIALGMFFTQYSHTEPLDKIYNGLRVGFYENRLYGLFADPNFAATISVVSMILSVKLLVQKLAKKWIILVSINIALQWIYIVLSGSRTAYVELLVVIFVGIFFSAYRKFAHKSLIIQIIYALISGLVSVLLAYVITKLIEKGMLSILEFLREIRVKDVPNVSLERPDVENKSDISNNRFGLWQSSIDIFKTSIWFGTSPRNLVSYAQEILPNTLIAIKEQTSHNFFFYVLATTGLAGIIPLMAFLVSQVFSTLKALFSNKKMVSDNYLLYDTLIVLTIFVSALFLTELILVNKIGTFLFWLYLGVIYGQTKKNIQN
ncbi:O-antigen ligase family protein [Enterococcus sp. AZ192]|uniref:O-antigen ligase family protein n=1 Tax=unclassified Enterococcus TaxID=2608891 RepID=UPI003D28AD50